MRRSGHHAQERFEPLIDDAAAEQLLTGAPVAPEFASLATTVEAVRQEASRPVTPSAALAELMSTGFRSAPQPALAPAHHARAPGPLVTTIARITRARALVGAAAVGAVLAVSGVATAGFAGALPPQVQHRFEVVIESITPYEFKESPAEPGSRDPDPTGEPATPMPAVDTDDPTADADAEPAEPRSGDEPEGEGPGRGVDGREVGEGVRGGGTPPGAGQPGRPEGGPPGLEPPPPPGLPQGPD